MTRLANRRVLVTGASGFIGRRLVAELAHRDVSTAAIVNTGARPDGSLESGRTDVRRGDIRDPLFVKTVIWSYRPTDVVHLAAMLPGAPGDAEMMRDTNVTATESLLNVLHEIVPDARVLIASSSGVYGNQESQPVCEDAPLRPQGTYAETKAAQEAAALRAVDEMHSDVVIARMFNLIGPGQSPRMLLPTIARQVVQAERGLTNTLRLGDLSPRRDYVDVRDAVRALLSLISAGESSEAYNICSGTSRSGQECLDLILRMSKAEVSVEFDEVKARPGDIRDQTGDFGRLRALSGWHPRISFEDSVRDLLEDWRGRTE